MLLNTFLFFVFFLVVFFLYWKIPKNLQWIILLLAGYFFVASWKPAYLGIIVLTTLINYYFALKIYKNPKQKKILLISALVFDLGVLFIFKYLNFFSVSLSQILQMANIQGKFPEFSLLAPIGISFYTFQTIGYMVDVYRGKIKPEKHLGFFALFVCFFPQLSAGPIERAEELIPQLKKPRVFNSANLASGMKLFTFGLFKKMVIADNLAIIVDTVFNSLPTYKGASLVLVVLFFSWQLYADFSGYTDMSRGVARMLGIDLIENFNMPYLSTSIQDFWRRWHISLSRFFRDYLYIPLGGSRKGLFRTCLNTIIVFVLCGIWHGASLTFIIWGLFHGVILVGERLFKPFAKHFAKTPTIVKIFYAYTMVSISWIFFRANNLSDAFYILRYSLSGVRNFISPSYINATLNQMFAFNKVELVITLSVFFIALSIEIISRFTPLNRLLNKQPSFVRLIIYIVIILAIIQFRSVDIKQFIYVRF